MKWVLRIFCLFFPLLGFLLAVLLWAIRLEKTADEVLFSSFMGIFFNLFVLLPLFLIIRAVFFSY